VMVRVRSAEWEHSHCNRILAWDWGSHLLVPTSKIFFLSGVEIED